MRSRLCNHLFLAFAVILLLSQSGLAADQGISKYPDRPINFVIPALPGSAPDLASRLICREAEKTLGQPIIPVNKTGGSFAIGTAAIAAAKPDGYTIGNALGPAVFVVPLVEKISYNPVKDLKWIMQFGYLNLGVLVKGNSQFKTFNDLITFARQNPKKLTHGNAGIGSFGHIAIEQIARKEGVTITHIPFKGGPDMTPALMGGHIHFMTGDFNEALIEAGEIRMPLLLAETPSTEYPKIPTLRDLGYDVLVPSFVNVSGPKGMPDDIAGKLEAAFTGAMKSPAFTKGMKGLRVAVLYRNGNDLSDYVARNYEVFGRVLKEMGLAK